MAIPHNIPRARKIILISVLIATTIVLQRFLAFRTPIIQINFMFVPIMIAGILLNWPSAIFVATVSDLIGAILFPSGSFFFGYTLTAFLTGFVSGVCLYRPSGVTLDRGFVLRLVACILIITILLNGGLNTIWVLIMSKNASNIIIPIRIIKQLVMVPVMFVTMIMIVKTFAARMNSLVFAGKSHSHD